MSNVLCICDSPKGPRVAQACRFWACLRSADPEKRIHPDKKRRDVCATREH